MAKPLETNYQQPIQLKTLNVFKTGDFPTQLDNVEESKLASGSPPKPLLIARPTVAGKYAVLLFIHGFCLENSFYTDLIQHIASHGFIVVAPQIYTFTLMPLGGQEEVELSIKVANWLPSGLKSVLNEGVEPDLDKLAISGHSRGAKAAFAIQLGCSKLPLTTRFSALLGLDPVAGSGKEMNPKILTYNPNSFNLSIPVTVIGTGLGPEPAFHLVPFWPPGAPDGVNHNEFYNECRAPASHFVATDYGHMDMLDDELPGWLGNMAKVMCKNSNKPKYVMRRTVGGITVAFLKAYLYGKHEDYKAILENPSLAPATLDPVEVKDIKFVARL